jgi:S-adenosylmethionine synthetase
MAGEFKVAEKAIQSALLSAQQTPSMSEDAMAQALQSSLISELLKHSSADDIRQRIEFLLENTNSEFMVVTRGC